MEASPQQQLPDGDGTVRVLGDRLVIEALTIEDERAARVVRDRAEAGHSPAETVGDALEIGARVLDREGTAAEADYVRNEFERAAGELGAKLGETIDGAGEGIGETLEETKDRIAEQLASHFDPKQRSAVQNQVREALAEFGREQLRAVSQLFSAEDGANPLVDFKQAVVRELRESEERRRGEADANRKRIESLTRELVELRQRGEADLRVSEAEEAGTRKGRTFEARVHAAIEGLATSRGDFAQHVGDEVGSSGSKKGDTVVEVGAAEGSAQGRIVFEAKDSQLSRPKAWEELNGALAARNADFSVLVVAGEESIPPGREQLTEYEGNKLIVAVDPDAPSEAALDVAYRFARLRVVLSRETALSVDAAGVRGASSEARAALDTAKAIKSSLTKATNNVDQARVAVEGMVATVLDRLERIESLVSAGE